MLDTSRVVVENQTQHRNFNHVQRGFSESITTSAKLHVTTMTNETTSICPFQNQNISGHKSVKTYHTFSRLRSLISNVSYAACAR